jgi:hypothetical protein
MHRVELLLPYGLMQGELVKYFDGSVDSRFSSYHMTTLSIISHWQAVVGYMGISSEALPARDEPLHAVACPHSVELFSIYVAPHTVHLEPKSPIAFPGSHAS